MKLSNLYNNVVGGVGRAAGKLSDFFSGTVSYEAPKTEIKPIQTPQIKKYALANRGAEFTDSDFDNLKPLIYGEVSNRDYGKKQLEADVIINTAINRQREYENNPVSQYRGKKLPISEIIAMPNQYQAYGGDQYNTYFNPNNPIDIAKKKEVDAIVDAIAEKIRRGEYVDNTEGAFYYAHKDDNTITYDNLRPLYK